MSEFKTQPASHCPECGSELPPSAPEGFCAKCLVSLARNPGGAKSGTRKVEDDETPEAIGSTIGRYRLLEQIGEGGFGAVYMAEQREPVTRKVALKIIKLGMDTKQVIARFESERQALALMDHPNIARVFDAGTTQSGRPYFVMELVRGVPIIRFCDENKLNSAERLGLFMDVCSAVQHAHQKGIIHRDLKPNNVLVTMNDDKPMPKIIDFGIAKATAQKLTDRTLFTQFYQFVGTPAYMSPEQAQMNNEDVDTRSDIYALGVLLYELLTGKMPFDTAELMAEGQEAVFRSIRETDPPRPSARMSTLSKEERSAAAQLRREAPEKLHGLLRGDLDWVVMKALEKDRQRRYETANALAKDVQRFLDNEPVSAVAPSPLYKFRKFVRRNRVVAAATAAVVVSLVLGLALALWSYARERDARATAQQEREHADTQRGIADAQRRKAEENEENVRRLRYAVDIRQAQIELEAGNDGRTRQILESHIPSNDQQDLRGWEWRYLWCRIREDALLSSRDSGLEISDLSVNTGEKLVAVGRTDGAIEIFHALSLERLRTLQEEGTGTGRGDPPSMVAFVPGKNLLATAGHPEPVIKFWNTDTWTEQEQLRIAYPEVDQSVWALRCSPDGKLLAMVTRRDDVRVLSLEPGETGKIGEPVIFHEGVGTHWDALAFSPDGRYFASGGLEIRVTDLHSDPLNHRPIHVGQRVNDLAFSPDGSILALHLKTSILLWGSEKGEEIGSLEEEDLRVSGAMVFMADGRTLVTTGGQHLLIWDVPSRKLTRILRGSPRSLFDLAAVGSSDHVITGSGDGTISRWDLTSPDPRNPLTVLPDIAKVVTFSGPDRAWLALTHEGSVALIDEGSLARIDENRPDRPKLTPSTSLAPGTDGASWSPHRQLLAVVGTDSIGKNIQIWSKEEGVFKTLRADGHTKCLTFHGQGSLLVHVANYSSFDIHAWDTRTWERVDDRIPNWNAIRDDFLEERDRRGGVNSFTVSPDESLAAIGTGRGRVVWYDLTKGKRLAEERCHSGWLNHFSFSQDGKFAASSLGGVVLWGTEPPRILEPRQAMGKIGGRLGFSADGSRLVTGQRNLGLLRIWDVRTSRHLLDLGGGSLDRSIQRVGFGPGGDRVFAVMSGGLHIWDVPSLAEIDGE